MAILRKLVSTPPGLGSGVGPKPSPEEIYSYNSNYVPRIITISHLKPIYQWRV